MFEEANEEPLEMGTSMIFYAECVKTIGEYFWLLGSSLYSFRFVRVSDKKPI